MKKSLILTAVMFMVSACAQGPMIGDEDCTYKQAPRKTYRVEPKPAPAPIVVQQPAPIVVQQAPCYHPAPAPVVIPQTQPCNGCQPTIRTTREPVEVVYKRVTYTTTYEPKTTSNVTYEREAVKNATVQEVKAQPVVKEVVIEQPAVSKVIETQVTQEPVKISIEEVK